MIRIVTAGLVLLIIYSFLNKSWKDEAIHKPSKAENSSQITPKPLVERPTAQASTTVSTTIFEIQKDDIVLGNRDAKVVIVEYSSPTCPHCSYYHKEVFPKLKEKYIDTNKIAYVFREFIGNKQDLDGAILGRCYRDEKDPLKLTNVLFAQQDQWAFNKNYKEILENIGQLAGISVERFNECLGEKDMVEFLASNSRTIMTYQGFPGTPSFFMNGKIHKGVYSVEALSNEIDKILAEGQNDQKAKTD